MDIRCVMCSRIVYPDKPHITGNPEIDLTVHFSCFMQASASDIVRVLQLDHELFLKTGDSKKSFAELSDEDVEGIIESLEQEFSDTNWFNKIIFQKWLLLGSLKKVSMDTKIPLTSIKRYVKDTKTEIKFNVIKRHENE